MQACAHRTALYVTEFESSGLTKGWWECKLCRAEFVPADTVAQAVKERDQHWLVEIETTRRTERVTERAVNEQAEEINRIHEQYNRERMTMAEELARLQARVTELEDAVRETVRRALGGIVNG